MRTLPVLFCLALVHASGAFAYGGGGGGSSGCEEPRFFEPKPSGTVPSLQEFTVVASDNTVPDTLSVEFNGIPVKPAVTRRRSGDFDAKAILTQPLTTPGPVRIGVKAKSQGGCWGFQPYTVEIKP
jgi:hypothetical protein